MVKHGQGKVGNAAPINHHQRVGAGESFWPPYRTKLLRLFHLSHSFSVTTECAVAESPSVAKSTTLSDNPNYILWSVDVRYIEKHQIPDHTGPVYLISILENYSRAVLASKISPTQNQWDYLEVLFAALSTAGVPKAIVSDGGGIFYCNQAMQVYQALGIEKLRIDKKQAWQNYH